MGIKDRVRSLERRDGNTRMVKLAFELAAIAQGVARGEPIPDSRAGELYQRLAGLSAAVRRLGPFEQDDEEDEEPDEPFVGELGRDCSWDRALTSASRLRNRRDDLPERPMLAHKVRFEETQPPGG